MHAFLNSGGEVGFGFATRPGTMTFTDGRQQRQARTWGEARELHALGWDPGAPGIPGVRVHLAGSRVERVVPADDVVLRVGGSSALFVSAGYLLSPSFDNPVELSMDQPTGALP